MMSFVGLGKTAQLCTHFNSLARPRENVNAIFLILCPATLLQHWLREMHRWSPSIRAVILHEISRTGGEVCRRTEKCIVLLKPQFIVDSFLQVCD
jgi:SNF2 family DNA or RNA helicase